MIMATSEAMSTKFTESVVGDGRNFKAVWTLEELVTLAEPTNKSDKTEELVS